MELRERHFNICKRDTTGYFKGRFPAVSAGTKHKSVPRNNRSVFVPEEKSRPNVEEKRQMQDV